MKHTYKTTKTMLLFLNKHVQRNKTKQAIQIFKSLKNIVSQLNAMKKLDDH